MSPDYTVTYVSRPYPQSSNTAFDSDTARSPLRAQHGAEKRGRSVFTRSAAFRGVIEGETTMQRSPCAASLL